MQNDYPSTITLIVRDTPGVLVRVAQVFSRRNLNIKSIHVEPTSVTPWSTMTITTSNISQPQQIISQLEKLVDAKDIKHNSSTH
ncbi:MAG TPA: ACT domain-containing protein [Patescibacteria group bacterium]|jgi:acetolactate synthase-1/3 small subunit|nr:ACT domain-containing protein [Patescibacteria group bacterium]